MSIRFSLLLVGRKGLVVAIANESSIPYGCARYFREIGARLAVTWLNEKAGSNVAWTPVVTRLWVALAFACSVGGAYADVSQPPGQQIYEHRCSTCHGGAAPADLPIGADLRGIIGRKAATGNPGVYSRALMDSGIVWDRDLLRRFLASPSATMPDSHASFGRTHPDELESLLDYLESLRHPDREPAAPK